MPYKRYYKKQWELDEHLYKNGLERKIDISGQFTKKEIHKEFSKV